MKTILTFIILLAFTASSLAQTTTIDASWLSTNFADPDNPIVLDTADETYELGTDVVRDYHAVLIAADGITLDLKGNDITAHNQTAQANVANGGFESNDIGDAADDAGTPGAYTGIDNWTMVDGDSPGSTIIAAKATSNGLFGANVLQMLIEGTGTEVDEDNAEEFKSDNIAIGENTIQHSLHFAGSGVGSGTQVQVGVHAASDDSELASGTLDGSGRMSLQRFVPTGETNVYVVIKGWNTTSSDDTVYVDAVSMQRDGICAIIADRKYTGDSDYLLNLEALALGDDVSADHTTTTPENFTLIDTVGGGEVSFANPCHTALGVYAVVINGLTIGGSGQGVSFAIANCLDPYPILASEMGKYAAKSDTADSDVEISYNNVDTSNTANISNRLNLVAAIRTGFTTGQSTATDTTVVIDENTLNQIPQAGIAPGGIATGTTSCSDNTLHMQTLVTNGYGIITVAMSNVTIDTNEIDGAGRGIVQDGYSSTAADNNTISNNTINVIERFEREYHTGNPNNVRAMRIRNNVDAEGPITDLTVSGNDATASTGYAPTVTIVSSGTTATATATGHWFRNGNIVTISGANESDYNGTFVVTRVDDDTFTYTMDADPVDTATGTITATDDEVFNNCIGCRVSFLNNASAMDDAGIAFNGNTWKAIAIDNGDTAEAFTITGSEPAINWTVTGDEFISNDVSLQILDGDGPAIIEDVDFVGCTFTDSAEGHAYTHTSLSFGYGYSGGERTYDNVQIIKNSYSGGATNAITFEDQAYCTGTMYFGDLVTITVVDDADSAISGASVSTAAGTLSASDSGTTDGSGQFAPDLIQYKYLDAAVDTTEGPIDVTVSVSGKVTVKAPISPVEVSTPEFKLQDAN